MGHSPEQRETHPLCGAKKKNGTTCRAFAGQGTDHPGTGRCKFHGGSTRNHKTAAITTEAKRRMVKLGTPIEVAPHEALMALLHAGSGHVAWLGEEIAAADDLGTFEGQVLTQMYGEERDRLARVAEACLRAGVSQEEIKLVQRFGEMFGGVVRSSLDAVEGLTEKQEQQFKETFTLELHALEATGRERQVLDRGRPRRAA